MWLLDPVGSAIVRRIQIVLRAAQILLSVSLAADAGNGVNDFFGGRIGVYSSRGRR